MCKGLGGGGIFSFLMATDTAADQAKVNAAKTRQRDARNQRNAANSTLARFNQSLSNNKLLDRAGKNLGAMSENLARSMDVMAYGDTMSRLAVSENLGSLAASAAAAGVGGSSVDNYNRTVRTAYSLQSEASERQQASAIYGANQARGSVITDAVDAMGRDAFVADQDFSFMGPTKGPSVLGNLATLAVAVAASAAGAPQIGDAILKAKTAAMQNNYGDPQGAARSFEGALQSFKGGVGEIRDSRRGSGVSTSLTDSNPGRTTAEVRAATTNMMLGSPGGYTQWKTAMGMPGGPYSSGITFR